MTLKLHQNDLCRFERLVSKLVKSSDMPQSVYFVPSGSSIKITAICKNAGVLTLTADKQGTTPSFALDWASFKSIAVKSNHELAISIEGDTVAMFDGTEKHRFSVDNKSAELPPHPKTMITHSLQILTALHEAARCTDNTSGRFALSAICLRGELQQIISTDGLQAFIQEKYQFPWNDDKLCPVSKIFGAKELRIEGTEEVQIGHVKNWIYFSIGNVAFWLCESEGKFPKLDTMTTPSKEASLLAVDPADAAFILDRLDKMPGAKEHESAIYTALEDKKKIFIRSHNKEQRSGTALSLTRSSFTGDPITLGMNRKFIRNALTFGCYRLALESGSKPVICKGNDKTFIFMTLSVEEPEYDAAKMNVLTSGMYSEVRSPAKSVPAERTRRRKIVTKSEETATVLITAEKVRQTLRDSLCNVNTLIREVKSQRRQDRLLRSTMDSLRKLHITP